MVLVLLLGDMHIPHRAADLPPQFKELLKPGKIHSILCAGNLCSKTLMEYLKSITSDVTLVQGDFDEFTSQELAVRTVGDFRLGLIHGHQVIPWGDQGGLSLLHRQLGVDVLVTAHVHEHKIVKTENGLQISLGSATGAYSSMQQSVTPSFVLLDIDGSKITAYTYHLVGGKIKIDRMEYVKPSRVEV
ncbi:subunit of retromer complex [Dunaliella salina]|uniref:Vacuolar protein sorting-associated protein 29 n=1 Tax=Dunaliella salina TaxID=3046 RepID=A0ABQ7HAF4_DUNSA|nr:subunit of retromer complex [Dunaliella salina]|eukprot:KAF5843835.1 subunit of retromer complex [Dunaliella salina]